MFYTYRNLEVLLDNNPIWANSATFSVDDSIQPNYLVGNRYTNNYAPVSHQVGSLRLNYYITGADYLKSFLNNDTVNSVSGYFGGFYFNSGYIKSFSIQGEVNSPVMASAELLFFQEVSGSFNACKKTPPKIAPLHFSDASITADSSNEINGLNNISNFTYSYSQEVNPITNVESVTPNVSLGKRDISMSLEQFHIENFIPFSGKNAQLTISLKNPHTKSIVDTIAVVGKCYQKTISAETNKPILSTLNIQQNYIYSDPSISGFYPLTGGWGSGIMISGENLNNAVKILFYDVDQTNISVLDNSTISGNVPYNAISSPIKVLTLGGEVTSTDTFTIIDSGFLSNITAYKTTGSYATRISLSATNLSRLSRVLFYDKTDNSFATGDNLQQISDSYAYVTVPFNATATESITEYPWVISDLRNISGQINNFKVVTQKPNTLSKTGIYSGYLYLTGECLGTGANQIQFIDTGNIFNVFTGVPEYISRNYYRAKVPSGIRNSYVQLRRTGASPDVPWTPIANKITIPKYNPTAYFSGIQPSGRTGAMYEWTGVGFYPEIMYPCDDGYSIDFGGITGKTIRSALIHSAGTTFPAIYRYTGLVPSGVTSDVMVQIPTYTGGFHAGTGQFYLITDSPVITSITPQTGTTGSFFTIYGQNLWNLESITVNGTSESISPSYSRTSAYPIPNFYKNSDGSVGFCHSGYSSGLFSLTAVNNGGTLTKNYLYRVKCEPQFGTFVLNTSSGIYGDTCFIYGYDLDSKPNSTRMWIKDKGHPVQIVNYDDTYGNLLVFKPYNYEYGFTGGKVIINNSIEEKTFNDTFRYIPLPLITGLSTTTGYWTEKSAYGSNIDLMGSGLNSVQSVFIGNSLYPSLRTYQSEDKISISVHPQSHSDNLQLTYQGFGFPGYENSIKTSYFIKIVAPPILISGFDPHAVKPMQDVYISGSGFDRVTQVSVSGYNGQEVLLDTFTFLNNNTQIKFNTPSSAISGLIRVRQIDDYYDDSAYTDVPLDILPIGLYSGFYPSTGIAGDRICISGSGLSGITVLFDTYPQGYISGLNTVYTNDTGILFTVPGEIHSNSVFSSGFGVFAQYYPNLFVNIPIISGVALTGYNTGQTIAITGIGITDVNNYRFVITGKDGWEDLVDNAAVQYNYPTPWTKTSYTGYSVITGIVSKNFGGTGHLLVLRSVSSPQTGGIDLPSGYYYYTHTGQILNINPGAPFITGFNPLSGAYDIPITISGSGMKFVTGVYWTVGASNNLGTILTKSDYVLTAVLNKNNYPFTYGRIKTVSPFGSDQLNSPTWGHLGKTNYSSFTPTTGATGTAVIFTEDPFFAGIARSLGNVTGVYFGDYIAPFNIGIDSLGYPNVTGYVPNVYPFNSQQAWIKLMGYGGTFIGNSVSGGLFTFAEGNTAYQGSVSITGTFNFNPSTVPTSTGSSGPVGSLSYDNNMLYIKCPNGKWRQIPLEDYGIA